VSEEEPTQFSSAMPVIVYTRPRKQKDADWQELDRGPGYFSVPAGHDIRVRMKSINDAELAELVKELEDVEALRFLDLSENRNITGDGMQRLKTLTQLTGLNLSSCSINTTSLEHLLSLTRLETLNLSYCNRLTDAALKYLEAMRSLTYVDMQGCVSITKGGLARVRRRDLDINIHR
jgi:hypothetical protein